MHRQGSITAYQDGPFLVRGPVTIVGEDGEVMECRREVVPLCRCGRSREAPICDGSHAITRRRRRRAHGAAATASPPAGS